jgi:hypothetical protein
VRADESFASAAGAADRPDRHDRLRGKLATASFWLLGSALVAVAQPSSDRKLAAAGAAVAGIATILVVSRLTHDPGRRYFRSLLGAIVAVSVVGDWLVQHLISGSNGFIQYGLDTRIALPLIFVLLAPVVLGALPVRLRSRALWHDRALILREARPLDWLAAAYALLILPDLALGVAHHAPKSYIAQDLGLIVFFLFAYVAGRTINADTGRESAVELVSVLLLLAAAQKLFGWDTTPLFTYVEAACAGALAFMLFQPRKPRLVALGLLALVLLGADAIAIKNGTGSTTAVELAAALGIIGYLVVRERNLLPESAVVTIAVAVAAGFLAFTADGVTVRGQYHGSDQSQIGRTYEAHQVREAIHSSPISFLFGRGLGGSIDETKAPKLFAESLVYGGRDLAHVQEVHLLPYEFLLKYGLLGFAWLAALVVGISILCLRALETATRHRDATPVVYAALPLLGIAAALAAATHLQDNPLNALAVGVLVTRLEPKTSPSRVLRFAVPAAAVVCAAVGAVAFSRSPGAFPFPAFAGGPGGTNAAVVGGLRVEYPRYQHYHARYFSTQKHAVTGVRHVRVHGVVIASYPLKRSPELSGSGQSLPSDGLFFELYQAPRKQRHPAPTKTLPLTIFDFPDIAALRITDALEQGGVSFSVNGRNYRAILWVGKHAPKAARVAIDYIVLSIQVKK